MSSQALPCEFDFREDGVAVLAGVAHANEVSDLIGELQIQFEKAGGTRLNAIPSNLSSLIGTGGALSRLAADLLEREMRPVRVLLFDKSASRNWGLSWHQDRAIPVAYRHEVEGYRNWTVKHGVHHVEPPAHVLADMVALRLHLDPCDHDNGPLEVARGSWRAGRLAKPEIRAGIDNFDCVPCIARAGDVVAMRGLTLHRSQPARRLRHRRVVHVDYAGGGLPGGLEWASV